MSWRAGIAVHSKFRNVFGEPFRKDKSYENIRISKNAWDGNYCAVNPKFLAVVLDTSGGGGAFLVIPVEKVGHQKTDLPKVVGHQREVLDIQWNPFNDHIIASASEDTTVKIWRIPADGLTEDLLDPLVDLRGHQRKVGLIRWHPTANGIIASAAFDFKVILWNALKAKALCTIDGHRDTIYDLAFSYNGSLIATTSKDKKIRVFNARTGKCLQTIVGHGSPKPSHVSFTDKVSDHLITTGFSSSGEREISLWSIESGKIKTDVVDHSSSILMLHYDMEICVAYVAGKGDGMIKYYEVLRDEPYFLKLSEYRHAAPQKSLGKISKRSLDTSRCEIYRFYKIHPNNWIEPLSMICPRRSDEFQEDLYPPFPSTHPALSADEWINGTDKDPVLMSFTESGLHHDVQTPTSPTSSSAEKFNNLFSKPAKFEKQSSKDVLLPNDIDHSSPAVIQTTVHAVNDAELEKLKQKCKDQEQEIEGLKRTLTTKDQRIFKLEMELSSKTGELSEMKEELSKKSAELKVANRKLEASAGTSMVDGGRPQTAEDSIVKRSNQVTVESMPRDMLVQETITSSKKTRKPLDDFDFDSALDDMAPSRPSEPGTVYTASTHVYTTDTHPARAAPPVEDHHIEDIEAELESLREDLAKTREVRVKSSSLKRGPSQDGAGSYSRVVYSDTSTETPRQATPRANYVSSSPPKHHAASRSPPRSAYHGYADAAEKAPMPAAGGNAEASGYGGQSRKSDHSEGSRMVVTTASYSRPRVPSLERASKDKKSYL